MPKNLLYEVSNSSLNILFKISNYISALRNFQRYQVTLFSFRDLKNFEKISSKISNYSFWPKNLQKLFFFSSYIFRLKNSNCINLQSRSHFWEISNSSILKVIFPILKLYSWGIFESKSKFTFYQTNISSNSQIMIHY